MISGKWNKMQYCFASCQTNLVAIFAKITDLLDKRSVIEPTHLDFSKAFNTESHGKSLIKLGNVWISVKSVKQWRNGQGVINWKGKLWMTKKVTSFLRIYLRTCSVLLISILLLLHMKCPIWFADEYKVVRHWSIGVRETKQNFIVENLGLWFLRLLVLRKKRRITELLWAGNVT